MQSIIQDLSTCLEERQARLKEQPDYLDLRGGKFSCKAGFATTTDPVYGKPSIILDPSVASDLNISSSAVFS